MAPRLPNAVDYRRLLADGGVLVGEIDAASLARVTGNFRVARAAQARLGLVRDARGQVRLQGDFNAALEARCQRCLAWMPLELSGAIDLVIIEAGSAAPEPDEADDVLEVRDGKLAVWALIEDELLLATPMIPLHDARDCAGNSAGNEAAAATPARQKPFAALGALLDAQRTEDD